MEVRTKTDAPADPRAPLREAREQRLKVIAGDRAATVKVYPATEDVRRTMYHPNNRVRFRAKLDQPVEWPNDSFTTRRLAEGSILTEAASGDQPPDDPKLGPRAQAHARRPKPKEAAAEHPAEQHHARTGRQHQNKHEPEAAKPEPATS